MSAAHSRRASIAPVLLVVLLQVNSGVQAQSPGPNTASANPLSANALYREFQDNPVDATDRYAGRADPSGA